MAEGPRLFAATAFDGLAFFPKALDMALRAAVEVGGILCQSGRQPKAAGNVEATKR